MKLDKLHKRLNQNRVCFEDLFTAIQMMGNLELEEVADGKFITEEYIFESPEGLIISASQSFNKTTKETKRDLVIGEIGSGGAMINEEDKKGKTFNISSTPDIKIIAALFNKNKKLYMERWAKLLQLNQLQIEIFQLAGIRQ